MYSFRVKLNCLILLVSESISCNHAWLAVEKTRIQLFGDYTMSFEQLCWYVEAAMACCNPGSYLKFECDDASK